MIEGLDSKACALLLEKVILNSANLFDFIPSKEGQGIQVQNLSPPSI